MFVPGVVTGQGPRLAAAPLASGRGTTEGSASSIHNKTPPPRYVKRALRQSERREAEPRGAGLSDGLSLEGCGRLFDAAEDPDSLRWLVDRLVNLTPDEGPRFRTRRPEERGWTSANARQADAATQRSRQRGVGEDTI